MQPLVRRFDHHVPADVRRVAETAELLKIREIEVFEHAHRWWYESTAEQATLDRAFADYLLREQVAAWVRQYCRRVLNLAAVDQLDPRDFGVERPTVHRITSAEQFYAGLITLTGMLVFLLIFA